jgi:hypothetical protein
LQKAPPQRPRQKHRDKHDDVFQHASVSER